MRWMIATALAFSLAFSAAAAPASSAADQARIKAIETRLPPQIRIEGRPVVTHTLAEEMARLHVPGVSIAYFEHGRILWAKGFGLADVASGRPVTPDTVFQAASISKPTSTIAAMSLVQQGKLTLDEDVNLRLKGWQVPPNAFTATEKVTLRRLLSHTAGLTVHGFPGYERGAPLPTPAQILTGAPPANTPAVVVDATPGTRWSYSGGGFVAVQMLMVEATGQTYPEIMRTRVLEPAGMTRSTYQQPLPDALAGSAATGYRADGTPVTGGWHVYPEMAPAGLWTTPSDLARLGIAFQRAHAGASTAMLSKAGAEEMLKRGLGNFGLGFSLGDDPRINRVEHGGSNEGYLSEFTAFTDASGRGVAIMTNGNNGSLLIPEILRAVALAYDWPILQPGTRRLATVDPATLDALAGGYQIKGLPTIMVTRQGDGLQLVSALLGVGPQPLLPQAPDAWFTADGNLDVTFVRDPSGRIGKIAMKTIYGPLEAVRLP